MIQKVVARLDMSYEEGRSAKENTKPRSLRQQGPRSTRPPLRALQCHPGFCLNFNKLVVSYTEHTVIYTDMLLQELFLKACKGEDYEEQQLVAVLGVYKDDLSRQELDSQLPLSVKKSRKSWENFFFHDAMKVISRLSVARGGFRGVHVHPVHVHPTWNLNLKAPLL